MKVYAVLYILLNGTPSNVQFGIVQDPDKPGDKPRQQTYEIDLNK